MSQQQYQAEVMDELAMEEWVDYPSDIQYSSLLGSPNVCLICGNPQGSKVMCCKTNSFCNTRD
jgi:hypothetical protein